MKNLDLNDPNNILDKIRELENMAALPAFDLSQREDIQVKIRVDERVGPARFKPDILIPGGFVANSLTIRAMRPNIFMVGDSMEDLSAEYECKCGETFDIQFWKLCPHCGRDLC